jgi:hypothetical protein
VKFAALWVCGLRPHIKVRDFGHRCAAGRGGAQPRAFFDLLIAMLAKDDDAQDVMHYFGIPEDVAAQLK